MSESGSLKRKLDDEDESTGCAPPAKRQKTDDGCAIDTSLPEYRFEENSNLVQSDAIIIGMDELCVTKTDKQLYTRGCRTCAALIIVAKMSDGDILHGMLHDSSVRNSEEINSAFQNLVTEFESVNSSEFNDYRCYLVTTTELKEKRIRDAKNSTYDVCVLAPDVTVVQVDKVGDEHVATVDVKLSDSLIEVKYHATED